MAKTSSQLEGMHHQYNHHRHEMSTRGPYEMTSLGSALGFACRSLLGSWHGGCGEHFT